MPYPVYHNPDPALKGVEHGNCNRTACQGPNAVWYNESTQKFYCRNCAVTIQREENDRAFFAKEPPMQIFKGVFDPTDPRHKIRCTPL